MTTNPRPATGESFSNWFSLADGRDNFHIDPDRDHQFLFGKHEWRDDIDRLFRRALALHEPVRLVWWGQYGIGKTHRLRFMDFWIRENDFDFFPVHVVCRDIDEKSRFSRLHFDLINNLGRERMQPLVSAYIQKLDNQTAGVVPLETLTTSPDIVSAVHRLATRNAPAIQLAAWKYLTGEDLDHDECTLAGVTRDSIDSSVEYAGVVKVLGTIIAAQTGKQVVYLVDQVEALSKIHQRSIEGRWVETLRAVLDIQNVGIVMAIGAERMDGLPSIMLAPEIIRRFTIGNYVEISAFKREHTTEFLQELLRHWVDAKARDQRSLVEKWASTPGYDAATYPLTRPAFEIFCRYCSDELDHKTAKPSEIIEQLNRVAAEAYFGGRALIDVSFLKDQKITA